MKRTIVILANLLGFTGAAFMMAAGAGETNIITFDDPSVSVIAFTVGPEHVYLTISEQESDIWVMDLDW